MHNLTMQFTKELDIERTVNTLINKFSVNAADFDVFEDMTELRMTICTPNLTSTSQHQARCICKGLTKQLMRDWSFYLFNANKTIRVTIEGAEDSATTSASISFLAE